MSSTKQPCREYSAEFSPPRYAFTPRPINAKIPKAWERRPATPFKPRGNGKQKIWKRIGTDENEVDNAFLLRKHNKDDESKRAVKKMKIGDAALPGILSAYATSFDDEERERTHKIRNINENKEIRPERRSSGAKRSNSVLPNRAEQGQGQDQKNQFQDAIVHREELTRSTSDPNTAFDPKLRNSSSEVDPDESHADGTISTPEPATNAQNILPVTQLNDRKDCAQTSAATNNIALGPASNESADHDSGDIDGEALTAGSEHSPTPLNADQAASEPELSPNSHNVSEKVETTLGLGNGSSTTDSDSTETMESPPENSSAEGPESTQPEAEPMIDATDRVEVACLPSSLTKSFIECTPDDDTEFLQGFLSRAKAKKAAKAAIEKDGSLGTADIPPARNTRSRSAIPSSQRETRSSKTSAGETDPSIMVSLEEPNTSEQSRSSPRRSTRARLPKPQAKVTPTVPNTIPVRRSNGTEFVFLQRDEAQKVALATRQNTARNKGEAVHPVFRLQSLNTDERPRSRSRSRSPRKRTKTEKQVQWDAELAKYYHEKEKERKRKENGGARKIRRLGTPAPKRKKIVMESPGVEE